MSDQTTPDFVPIPLSKLYPDEALCTDIYLLINSKYIKYKNAEDFISVEKYDLFLSKNVISVYIAFEDSITFMNWLKETKEKSIQEVVDNVGEEFREEAVAREEIVERVFETFAAEELNKESVSILKSQAEELIESISKKKIPLTILARLTKKSPSIAEHSVNVANISVYIALAMGHAHRYVLENIYMGALFHDYGKAKIPSKVLEDPSNITYTKAIEQHPIKGALLISKIDGLQDQVTTIIAEHHEQHNGKGFPNAKKGEDIYELSKIVALANVFDNICANNMQKGDKEMYKQAIKFLEHDKGKKFDPDFLTPAIEALYLAYK